MTLNLKGTNVLIRNLEAHDAGYRNIVNEGGSGSSKTWSLCQALITLCFRNKGAGLRISIVRVSLPDLRKSVMRDFFTILRGAEIYDESAHSKTENTYTLQGNLIEFFGLDTGQKVRGARRDYAWFNESNEVDLDSYRQIAMRTRKAVFFDYNPSEQHHWIYDEVLSRKDTALIHSTYRDNLDFLSEAEKGEIESFRQADQNYWRVFGQGKRGMSGTRIYNHWQQCDALPEGGDRFGGLDFGWSNPAALVEVVIRDGAVYVEQKFYRSHMTDDDIIAEVKTVAPDLLIYGDNEDPQAIASCQAAGLNVFPMEKGPGSVLAGIREIQKRPFYIVKGSTDTLKEAKLYSWRTDKNGQILDVPVKVRDHAMDAIRGAVYSHFYGVTEQEEQVVTADFSQAISQY